MMQPDPVDVHVGRRLRSRRTILGMSQEELGDAVGVTFQQIQKYERGMNRIGSSRLYNFARVLGVNVSFFFEDFRDPSNDDSEFSFAEDSDSFIIEEIDNKELLSLVRSFQTISDKKVRRKVLSLIRALGDNASSEEDT